MELDRVSRRDVIKGIVVGVGGSVFATAVPSGAGLCTDREDFPAEPRDLLPPPLSRACGTELLP